MCGIFGFTGRSSWKTSVLLQSLCIEDEVRGKHSTGIVIQSDNECLIQKKALRGKDFVSKGYTDFLFKKRYGLALGHNRYATTGAVNDRNAHPFGTRVANGWNFGVHNGIVGGKEKIAESYGIPEPEVDSEIVFRAIAKMQNSGMDVVDAIENITEFISADADFAFAYLDTKERTTYLWRSPERPLVILDARRLGLGRWFCSTKDIFATAWSNLRGSPGDIRKVTYFEAIPYRLYKVIFDDVYEVEPIRDLRRKSRREEKKFFDFREDDYRDSRESEIYTRKWRWKSGLLFPED